MKRLLLLCLLLLSSLLVLAAPERNAMPDPELLLEADSYSIAVVALRPDDEAIKSLLEAVLQSISSGETSLPASMAEVSDYLSRNNRADLLFAGLPFQGVRIDRMLTSHQSSPSYSLTLAGWKGLQAQVFNSLSLGPEGKAFPSLRYRVTDLVFREHSDDPTWAGTLCRVQGTFLFSPGAEQAKRTVDRLVPKDKPLGPLAGPLLTAYRSLPKTADAFGVLLNQKGAFSALLKSLDNDQVNKFRERVGSERLESALTHIGSLTWGLEIVNSDRAEVEGVLAVDLKDQAEVSSLLEEGRASLDPTRVAEYTISQSPGAVHVKVSILGLKKILLEGVSGSAR